MIPRISILGLQAILHSLLGVCLVLSGCGQAKQVASDTRDGYEVAKELGVQAVQLANSFKTNDWPKVKELAAEADEILGSRVVGWYSECLVIDERQGKTEALLKVEQLKKTDGITDAEGEALEKLKVFLLDKGNTKPSIYAADMIVTGFAIAAELKYGGRYYPHAAISGWIMRSWESFKSGSPVSPPSGTNSATP